MKTTIPALGKGLFLSWLLLLALPVKAATVAGLYEAVVPVTAEDTDSRNQAIGQALDRVLVKLTGRDAVPGAGQLAGQAARYVQQYRYRRALTPEGETRTSLWVQFDKPGLDRAMRDHGLPVWGSSRPGILVWLAVEQAGRRELAAADGAFARSLGEAAASRGLPLQWPLLDLEDQARLTSADLWSDYGPAVSQASRRYAQPLVLTGRLRQVAPDHWDARWTLYEGEHAQFLESAGADADVAIVEAVARLSELLAARYAPVGGDRGSAPVYLQIVGVRQLDDYARVLKLIGEREVVERVAVRSAASDSLLLEVLVRGGREPLTQVLDLQRGLEREPDPPQPLPSPVDVPPSQPAPYLPPAQPTEPAAVSIAPDGGSVPAAQPVIQPLPVAETPPPVPPLPVDLVYRLRG